MQSGAGPAIAGSEGSGFSLEKPPPEAESWPGYSENPVFAPPAQGLATCQAGTPQSAALPAPLPGEPLLVRIRPSFLVPLPCTALISLGCAEPASPEGKLYNLPLPGEPKSSAPGIWGRCRAYFLFCFFLIITAAPSPTAASTSTATAASSAIWSPVLGLPVRETALVQRA